MIQFFTNKSSYQKGSTLQQILEVIKQNSKDLNHEFRRLFHGRGKCYKGYEDITIDSIDTILFVQSYKEISYKKTLLELLQKFMQSSRHKILLFKNRSNNILEVIQGELKEPAFAIENGIKFLLDFNNKNIGYFGDISKARAYIKEIAKDKKVLNLFAYTCGFSLFARAGGASEIINIDMSKGALSRGMKNHAINNLSMQKISFWPRNILKSFAKIKAKALYDIVIIDPPTFQRGSFELEKDYQKIVTLLPQIIHKNSIILATLNAPYLGNDYLDNLFFQQGFAKIKNINPNPYYCNKEKEEALKIATFKLSQ